MLSKEANQLRRWSVVCKFCWMNITLTMQHLFEYLLALATSLHRLVDIEIENTERCDLTNGTILSSDEQLS